MSLLETRKEEVIHAIGTGRFTAIGSEDAVALESWVNSLSSPGASPVNRYSSFRLVALEKQGNTSVVVDVADTCILKVPGASDYAKEQLSQDWSAPKPLSTRFTMEDLAEFISAYESYLTVIHPDKPGLSIEVLCQQEADAVIKPRPHLTRVNAEAMNPAAPESQSTRKNLPG